MKYVFDLFDQFPQQQLTSYWSSFNEAITKFILASQTWEAQNPKKATVFDFRSYSTTTIAKTTGCVTSMKAPIIIFLFVKTPSFKPL